MFECFEFVFFWRWFLLKLAASWGILAGVLFLIMSIVTIGFGVIECGYVLKGWFGWFFFFYIYYQFVSVRKFELLSGCSFLGKPRWELFDHGIKMCRLWNCNRSLCRDQWGPHQLITLAKFCCIVHYRSTLWVIEAQLCQDSLS